jgi:hypothetical protein
MAKIKADPFFARPDGSRAKSAWLTKLQATAREIAEKANKVYGSPLPCSFLSDNRLEQNLEYLRNQFVYSNVQRTMAAWECLLQWHGELALPYLETRLAYKEAVKLIATLQSDAAQTLFLDHLDLPNVRSALADSAKKWPHYTLRGLLAKNPSRDQPAAHLLLRLLHANPEWLTALQTALQAEGDEAQAATLARLLTPAEKVTEASVEELPALLREPPWRAAKARAALPVLALIPRREPAIVDWSRWQGGTVEPRPQVKSSTWYQIRSIRFDDDPSQVHDFLQSEGIVSEAAWQEFSEKCAEGGYPSLRAASMQNTRPAFDTILRFLRTTGKLTNDDLEVLSKRDDLYCSLEGREMSLLCIRGTYYEVEKQFHACLDDQQREDPTAANAIQSLRQQAEARWGRPGMALFLWGVRPDRIAAVLADHTIEPGDLSELPSSSDGRLNHLGHLDDALALSLLRQQKAAHVTGSQYEFPHPADDCGSPAARLLKRFGAGHIEAILAVMPLSSSDLAQKIMDIVDWDGMALHLSRYGYTVNSQLRAYARNWLLAHPRTTARALIPAAFSDDAATAAHARHHLYLLATEGHSDLLKSEAEGYGAPALAAVEQLLATAPEALLPAPLPKLPAWLVLPRLPRLLLAGSGHAVPLAHLPDALLPLALSKGGLIYPGLEKLQAAVTPDSLARLMLGLFEQWLENGLPAKDRWILELQGRLGDDANARALAPRIREWRSHLDRVRSYEGLELLAQIGSDTALMLLSTFREQKRYGDLQERAAKALARVAEERGLTLEQLADRTVPTLGLDERGLLTLDFGPRQFTARLNADLTPQVQDAEGARLKDLPKPGAKDDATQAKAAVADWKEFKKQAKLVASTQTVRLEAAMCAQRRWPAADFLAFFAHHPVLRTLCQRLVWATFDGDGALTGAFRVSEDLSLADVDDAPFELQNGTAVGLPHPLELEQDQREQWATLLADYKILQPFEQLARLTCALPPEDMPLATLPRYQDRRLSTGSLLGLEQRGWKRDVGEGGTIGSLEKPLGEGYLATLVFEPGWFVGGAPTIDEEQEIQGVYLSRLVSAPNTDGTAPPPPAWQDLSTILQSEMLRDLERLAWHSRD